MNIKNILHILQVEYSSPLLFSPFFLIFPILYPCLLYFPLLLQHGLTPSVVLGCLTKQKTHYSIHYSLWYLLDVSIFPSHPHLHLFFSKNCFFLIHHATASWIRWYNCHSLVFVGLDKIFLGEIYFHFFTPLH